MSRVQNKLQNPLYFCPSSSHFFRSQKKKTRRKSLSSSSQVRTELLERLEWGSNWVSFEQKRKRGARDDDLGQKRFVNRIREKGTLFPPLVCNVTIKRSRVLKSSILEIKRILSWSEMRTREWEESISGKRERRSDWNNERTSFRTVLSEPFSPFNKKDWHSNRIRKGRESAKLIQSKY